MTPEQARIVGAVHLDRRQRRDLALELGLSTTVLMTRMLHLAQDPQVYARYPRECRVILDRRDELRLARSAVRLRGH